MSYADIDDGTGKTRRVSLDEVDLITSFIDSSLTGDKLKDLVGSDLQASVMLKEAGMDEYQLRWLADILIHKLFSHERSMRRMRTRRHRDVLNKLIDLRDSAASADPPVDIWPELDE